MQKAPYPSLLMGAHYSGGFSRYSRGSFLMEMNPGYDWQKAFVHWVLPAIAGKTE